MEILANDVREWAREQGIAVGERGRMSLDVWVAYLSAHPAEAKAVARKVSGIDVPKRGKMSGTARLNLARVLR